MATTTEVDARDRHRRRSPQSRLGAVRQRRCAGSCCSRSRSPSSCPSCTRSWAASGPPGRIRNDPAGPAGPLDRRPTTPRASGGDLFWSSLWNSIVIAVITVVVVVAVSALAAYVFARFAFPGREALFTLFALGLLFPAAVAILPLYILLRTIGPARQPARRGAAAGRVRHPAHDHHPAAVLREHPARSWRTPPPSTAAAGSGSSGGCCCRCRDRRSRPWRSSRSWAAGTRSCCRCSSSAARTQWTLPLGVMNFSQQYSQDVARRPRVHRRCRWSRRSCSTSSRSASSSAA